MIDSKRIFSLHSTPSTSGQTVSNEFKDLALEVFRFQAGRNGIYKQYLEILGVQPNQVRNLDEIPFLPIELFKTQRIVTEPIQRLPENLKTVFTSSGTTGMIQSQHEVQDLTFYETSFRDAFDLFYGSAKDWTILALLPSYQERVGSSLIYMVDDLINQSKHPESGYFLYDLERLKMTLQTLKEQQRPTMLIGVTFALLDFAEQYSMPDFPELIVMETGGMKGRRKEMIRDEVHRLLQVAFGPNEIHSEYGMTELLSQAYARESGIFECPPWMTIFIRDANDPFSVKPFGHTGGINVIDLANIYSCSFIAT